MSVLIDTSIGELVIDLFVDECAVTTKNFLKLCKVKYYNNCAFHKVESGFIAQTGDPTGTGFHGDSISGLLFGSKARFFNDEIRPQLTHKKKGTVAMASAGPNLNASQFYITLADNLDYLDGTHTVFGEIAEGFDVLDKLNSVFVDEKHRPLKNIRIRHTMILDDPFPDPPTLVVPDLSPVPSRDQFDEDYIADEDDEIDAANAKKSQLEIEEELAMKEERNRAEVLEMLGDLPSADFRPPDNVLFVCKLNPVTMSEDLELIFSRFGNIKKCEVIRDYKTNDSLQYAFIEFETDKECEQAYLKMENVLIDDRRIHVDFSQSVSGMWNSWQRGEQMGRFDADKSNLTLKSKAPDSQYKMVFDQSMPKSNPKERSEKKPFHDKDSKKIDDRRGGHKWSRSQDRKQRRSRSRDPNRRRSRSPDRGHHRHGRRSRSPHRYRR